jgi:hypothetical protein
MDMAFPNSPELKSGLMISFVEPPSSIESKRGNE